VRKQRRFQEQTKIKTGSNIYKERIANEKKSAQKIKIPLKY
jgi:hypothetical protein